MIAEIPYTADTGEKLVNETYGPNNIRRNTAGTMDPRPMRIENARPLAGELSLDRNGFVFLEHNTAVQDFFDKPRLETAYYPEVEQLIKRVAGASRVVVVWVAAVQAATHRERTLLPIEGETMSHQLRSTPLDGGDRLDLDEQFRIGEVAHFDHRAGRQIVFEKLLG